MKRELVRDAVASITQVERLHAHECAEPPRVSAVRPAPHSRSYAAFFEMLEMDPGATLVQGTVPYRDVT